mgnify:CR=1 FL=1
MHVIMKHVVFKLRVVGSSLTNEFVVFNWGELFLLLSEFQYTIKLVSILKIPCFPINQRQQAIICFANGYPYEKVNTHVATWL